jgi:FkbM family methyltransferase
MTPTAVLRPPPAAGAGIDTWTLRLDSGLALHTPPTLKSMTTFVLMEQERWFEPEMSLLPHVVGAGTGALDIGANHGVVALEMARCAGPHGHVWAFEPTAAPRAALGLSVRDNGFRDRITVLRCGLAEAAGSARFAVQANSELNSRHGTAEAFETVELRTLDACWAEAGEPAIGFVKLDAEGDESRVLAGGARFFAAQSPVVMFELKHGAAVNHALLADWAGLGYGLFRWSHELQLLRPFDTDSEELAFALNLVAVRPAQQRELAARGLLVTREAFSAAVLPAPDRSPLAWWAAAHFDERLAPAQRLAAMLLAGAMAQGDATAATVQVNALHATGRQHGAVSLAARLLAAWDDSAAVPELTATPLRADLYRSRSTEPGPWLRQLLGEFVAMHSAYSSYFQPPAPARWAALMQHPDHGAAVERRWLLAHAASDRVAPAEGLAALTRLPDAAHTANPALWRGIIDSMRLLGRG